MNNHLFSFWLVNIIGEVARSQTSPNYSISIIFMASSLISIQDAAELSGKSIQTIRRAIKVNKIAHKRKKTPQGFNYLINKESIVQTYKLRIPKNARKQGGLKKGKKSLTQEFATVDDLKSVQSDIEKMLTENEKVKKSFMQFMKTFQDRFAVMENQLKLLEEPNKKKWYQFWA